MEPSTSEKYQKAFDSPRDFKVVHQLVCLSDFDISQRSFLGYTELSVVPLTDTLSEVRLNCGGDVVVTRATVNDAATTFLRPNKFLLSRLLSDEDAGRQLRRLTETTSAFAASQDTEVGGGELVIPIPCDFADDLRERRLLKVGIEFQVCQPRAGVQFVSGRRRTEDGGGDDDDDTMSAWGAAGVGSAWRETAAHVFTYRSSSSGGGATRYWLPCVDAASELTTWTLQITTDLALTAVASGELLETEYTADIRNKTYYYQLSIPTSAINIGFAIGPFSIHVLPEMTEVSNFCLPKLLPLLKLTTSTLDRMFEFFEELLSFRFPYSTYKQVFVDQAAEEVQHYSGLSIFSTAVMYHRKVLDTPVPHSRQLMALALSHQFFSCYITQSNWLDSWVVRSIARYVTGLYVQRTFGNNEYRYLIHRTSKQVCDYESVWAPIHLRPIRADSRLRRGRGDDSGSVVHAECASPEYAEMLAKKGHLVLRMLELRLGKEPFLQVLHKVLAVGAQGEASARYRPAVWHQTLLLSTDGFFATVSNVTGQELPTFIDHWVYGGGHAHFNVEYGFNRKRNSIELEVKQDLTSGRGRQKYVGPLTVTVQELDGYFSQTIQIDDVESKHDLSCHSRGRKQKKKKVPLCIGEEVELDVSLMDPDSPVLWIRIDPQQLLIRRVDLNQPDFQWHYQLKVEKDVMAQLDALEVVASRFPNTYTRLAINEALENERFFYRVRCAAAFKLAETVNGMVSPSTYLSSSSMPPMMALFRRLFGSRSCDHIPRPNSFTTTPYGLQNYFLMQALPRAMALLRTTHGFCLPEVHYFIVNLLKYNDNSKNRYIDDFYVAALLQAVADTAPASTSTVRTGATGERPPPRSVDDLNDVSRAALNELTLAANVEQLKPSFGRVVAVAALRGFWTMMRNGHLPMDSRLFWRYVDSGQFQKVRMAALDVLVEFCSVNQRKTSAADDYARLLTLVVSEGDPGVRYHLARALGTKPPFSIRIPDSQYMNKVNTAETVDQLWTAIAQCSEDVRLRGYLVDLYLLMYGAETPLCLRADVDCPPQSDSSAVAVVGETTDGGNDQPATESKVLFDPSLTSRGATTSDDVKRLKLDPKVIVGGPKRSGAAAVIQLDDVDLD